MTKENLAFSIIAKLKNEMIVNGLCEPAEIQKACQKLSIELNLHILTIIDIFEIV